MTFAEAAEFYNLSSTTIQNWKRRDPCRQIRTVRLGRFNYAA